MLLSEATARSDSKAWNSDCDCDSRRRAAAKSIPLSDQGGRSSWDGPLPAFKM